jgi:hypothetical protein
MLDDVVHKNLNFGCHALRMQLAFTIPCVIPSFPYMPTGQQVTAKDVA